jgi:putative transposase
VGQVDGIDVCEPFFIASVHGNMSIKSKIQEYIANQLKDDLKADQLTLNEYIDPFTGEPVQKSRK